MSKIALLTSLDREDSILSDHFGKAKWIMIRDTEQGTSRFVQNEGLNGKSVVQHLIGEGCSAVLLREIGMGAFGHLKEANIRAWLAPQHVAVSDVLRMYGEGSLTEIVVSTEHAGSCGCTQRTQEKQCCGSCK